MIITATNLLELITKASLLKCNPTFHKTEDGDYEIKLKMGVLEASYYYDSHTYYETVVITKEGDNTFEKGTTSFQTMMELLDSKLEEYKREQDKKRRREELISKMTDEEKEILGFK